MGDCNRRLAFVFGVFWFLGAQWGQAQKRTVTLEWEPVDGASFYEVVLRPKNPAQQTMKIKTKQSEWETSLSPGNYQMTLRSYDARKVPGDWSTPLDVAVNVPAPQLKSPASEEVIRSSEQEKANVHFEWGKMESISEYILEIEPGNIKSKTSGNSLDISLPVAQTYRWRVLPKTDIPTDVDDKSWRSFTLRGGELEKPEVLYPVSRYIRDLKWNETKNRESYQFELARKSKRGWETVRKESVFKENQIPFSQEYPGGVYRFKIRAEAPLRTPSPYTTITFPIASGKRTPAAQEAAELRESLEKQKSIYLIGSYAITNMRYESSNSETKDQIGLNALGGTFRGGLGYYPRDRSWGLFGFAELSGFQAGEKRYTFLASEAQIYYRRYLGNAQLRAGGGVYYKELPDLKYELGTSDYQVRTIGALGPVLSLELWQPLTQKWGVQGTGRAYYSAVSMRSPNGQPVGRSLSYQLGALASYKYSGAATLFFGYLYRMDQMSYQAISGTDDPSFTSVASPGEVNEVRIDGHYLNLILELSF